MGLNGGGSLKRAIIEEIERTEPAIKMNQLFDRIDADHHDIIDAVEDLQRSGEISGDILIWRGGCHSSVSS